MYVDIVISNIFNLNEHFFFLFHCNNKANRLHRGSAIAIKNDINYRLLDDFETDLLALVLSVSNRQYYCVRHRTTWLQTQDKDQ